MNHCVFTAKRIAVVRATVFVAAVLMIVFGVHRGEPFAVLQKAARICLECIGIG